MRFYGPGLMFLALVVSGLAQPVLAQSPRPIVNGYVIEGFADRNKLTEGLPASVSYVHSPNDPALAGAFLWFETVPEKSARAAFEIAARTQKITNLRILATHTVVNANLLDAQGSGETIIGEGVRKG